jgi:hypothetical protein
VRSRVFNPQSSISYLDRAGAFSHHVVDRFDVVIADSDAAMGPGLADACNDVISRDHPRVAQVAGV